VIEVGPPKTWRIRKGNEQDKNAIRAVNWDLGHWLRLDRG